MDPGLKKMNEMLLKKQPSSAKAPAGRPILKRFILWLLIIAIPVSVILFAPLFQEREIIISGEKQSRSIIDLGFLGWIFPSKLKNKDRVNLLFLGIPGEGHQAPNLTDTIIIINSTPKGENATGVSIPRDLFVKNPNNEYYVKVNSLYEDEGIDTTKEKIKKITGLDINYFIVLDLEGVKKVIDQLGGIDVVIEETIYDPRFPAPYDSYEIFTLEKGTHHLNGETTLRYIRSRNQLGGDFARIKRQQQVIGILKDKILALNPIWNFSKLVKIWKTLNEHTHTNIDLTDMKYAWNLIKKNSLSEIKFITLSNQPDKKGQLLESGYTIIGNDQAYILKPKDGLENYEEIKTHINQLINNL